ncbi:hypothetical protein HK100_003356 [Physocladia obscura]|uniref:GAF domain-containing protein n=1 Tax=Physocladia obscura TaxID=109957 RepID=A0AAD5T7S5_9FUNG|nr:hypothetical protein HK100_003356 [Physocladia obscura]
MAKVTTLNSIENDLAQLRQAALSNSNTNNGTLVLDAATGGVIAGTGVFEADGQARNALAAQAYGIIVDARRLARASAAADDGEGDGDGDGFVRKLVVQTGPRTQFVVTADARSMSPSIEQSNYPTSKPEFYALLSSQIAAVIDFDLPQSANLANVSSVLFYALTDEPVARKINWCGFYLTEDAAPATATRPPRMVLGPFQGRVACTLIPFGKGVCGTAASEKKTQLVPNVHEFKGHIACDSASESEIVVPIIVDGSVKGVLDIDCLVQNGFDHEDQIGLETIVSHVARIFQ